jgi:hypothetical protein
LSVIALALLLDVPAPARNGAPVIELRPPGVEGGEAA